MWDVAGVLIERDLDADGAQPLLLKLQPIDTISAQRQLLAFYCLAYVAFRLGQMSLCAATSATHDGEAGDAAKARLTRACDYYSNKLMRLLQSGF